MRLNSQSKLGVLALTSLALGGAGSLFGSGFALHEHSVSGLGNGFAGGSAIADDASTIFFNPAGMTRFDRPLLTASVHAIMPEASYEDRGSTTGGAPIMGPNDTTDDVAIVPNMFYVHPVNESLSLGVGVSVPYGLVTDYEHDWVGRYVAWKSDLATINFNPALSWKVNDKLSLGFGLNIMRAEAELSNAIDLGLALLSRVQSGQIPVGALPPGLLDQVMATRGTTAFDAGLVLKGEDFGYGFNAGALYEISDRTRFGIHFRSEVDVELEGDADFTVGALEAIFGAAFPDQIGRANLDLPGTLSVSVYHEINDQWAIMADLFHTWWESFEYLVIEFEEGTPNNSIVPELWDNTFRYSIGTNYRPNDKLVLRAGLVYDESPVPSDVYRSPRIPDSDRIWLSFGLGYQLNDQMRFDAGYVHIFVDDMAINNPTHTAGVILRGDVSARVDIFSVSGSYRF